jgi:hypothetical protein
MRDSEISGTKREKVTGDWIKQDDEKFQDFYSSPKF